MREVKIDRAQSATGKRKKQEAAPQQKRDGWKHIEGAIEFRIEHGFAGTIDAADEQRAQSDDRVLDPVGDPGVLPDPIPRDRESDMMLFSLSPLWGRGPG